MRRGACDVLLRPSSGEQTIWRSTGTFGARGAWTGDEFRSCYELLPEKIEVREGRLFWSDEERLVVLGMLLENVGIDRAIRLGDPERWRAAVAELKG